MNDMVQRLDAIRPADVKKRAPTALSELEAFIQTDDLLADLNKQYLEAKRERKELVALNGADDAMTEVALDMEDSAWCAMQTRYLELRQDRELMAKVQRMMRQSEEEIEYEVKRDKERNLKQFIYYTQALNRMKEKNKTPRIFEWAILLLIFKMVPLHKNTNFIQQQMAA